MRLLREGTTSHELVFSRRAAESILARSEPDPALRRADIAFGQPDVASVVDSNSLRWIQLTSAGYARYDTPNFRVAARSRGLLVTNSSSVYAEAVLSMCRFFAAEARKLPQVGLSLRRWLAGAGTTQRGLGDLAAPGGPHFGIWDHCSEACRVACSF